MGGDAGTVFTIAQILHRLRERHTYRDSAARTRAGVVVALAALVLYKCE